MVLEETIINQLKEFLEKENISSYRKKGLNWNMQEKFYWLELDIIENGTG